MPTPPFPKSKATDIAGAVEVGSALADTDWAGGYRAPPGPGVAEGCVRPFVEKDTILVSRAASAYTQRFLHLLTRR